MKGRRKKSLKSSGRIANNESGVRTRYLLKGSKWRDHYINQSGSNILMLCYVMLCYVMLCYVMLCYVMFFLLRDAPASEFSCRRFGTPVSS